MQPSLLETNLEAARIARAKTRQPTLEEENTNKMPNTLEEKNTNEMPNLSELANSIVATQAVDDDAHRARKTALILPPTPHMPLGLLREAYRALSRLHKAHDNVGAVLAKIDGISASIETSTADMENFISKGVPPL